MFSKMFATVYQTGCAIIIQYEIITVTAKAVADRFLFSRTNIKILN